MLRMMRVQSDSDADARKPLASLHTGFNCPVTVRSYTANTLNISRSPFHQHRNIRAYIQLTAWNLMDALSNAHEAFSSTLVPQAKPTRNKPLKKHITHKSWEKRSSVKPTVFRLMIIPGKGWLTVRGRTCLMVDALYTLFGCVRGFGGGGVFCPKTRKHGHYTHTLSLSRTHTHTHAQEKLYFPH